MIIDDLQVATLDGEINCDQIIIAKHDHKKNSSINKNIMTIALETNQKTDSFKLYY